MDHLATGSLDTGLLAHWIHKSENEDNASIPPSRCSCLGGPRIKVYYFQTPLKRCYILLWRVISSPAPVWLFRIKTKIDHIQTFHYSIGISDFRTVNIFNTNLLGHQPNFWTPCQFLPTNKKFYPNQKTITPSPGQIILQSSFTKGSRAIKKTVKKGDNVTLRGQCRLFFTVFFIARLP